MSAPLAAFGAAFGAGAAVMGLELLASRWLAPAFGATLTTWSWVIAVTLGAGSLGAWLGGRTRPRWVAGFLLGAAVLLALEAQFAPDVVEALGEAGASAGPAWASLALLALPVALLSAVLPQVLLSAQSGQFGALLAVSTLGALTGTLVSGLWLIPTFGLTATGSVWAGVVTLAAAPQLRRRGTPVQPLLGLLLIGAVATTSWSAATRERHAHAADVVVAHVSLAGDVTLTRERSGLALRVDGVLQGTWAPGEDDVSLLARGQAAVLLPYLHPRATTALNVGLGSGLVARALARHGVRVLSLEVHPQVARVARERLEVPGEVRVGDGRALARGLTERFDLLVLDAFGGEGLPAHLLTHEAMALWRARLRPGGILCLHLIGARGDRVTASVWATLATSFPERLALAAGRDLKLDDLFLLASDVPLRLLPHPVLQEAGYGPERAFTPPHGGLVATDDRNPLERWHEPAAHRLRLLNRRTRMARPG